MKVFAYPQLGHYGRLGNQLWEVAATVAFARREGGRPSIPETWEYRPYLSVPEEVFVRPQAGDEVVDVAQLPRGPYFQSLRDIAAVIPEVRDWFRPSPKAQKRFREAHEPLLVGHRTAVHVRRTDYVQHSDKFPPLTPAYYLEALAQVYEKHPGTDVLVFSDDIPWCYINSEAFGFSGAKFIQGHVRPIEVSERIGDPLDILDLFLMASCQVHIIANSSFSWWGAFLAASKMVFYPDRWFGPSADNYDRMWECIPQTWVQIPC